MTGDQLRLDGMPPCDPARSQWHTSPKACERLAGWLPRLANLRVLEPSAGGGAIVQAVLDFCEQTGGVATVDAIEIDPAWCRVLRERFEGRSVNVAEADFLTTTCFEEGGQDIYDAAVMNSPLDNGQGPLHVERALRFAPRAIAVLTAGDMHNKGARVLLWRRFRLARLAHLGRWKIGGSSLRDFVAIDVRREPPGGLCEVTWWDC